IMREAQAVARAHGLDVAIDEARQADPQNRSEHRSSMLQDWDLGRPMEIDGIVRAVQDFARAAGIATPTLDVVSTLLVAKARAAGTYPGCSARIVASSSSSAAAPASSPQNGSTQSVTAAVAAITGQHDGRPSNSRRVSAS